MPFQSVRDRLHRKRMTPLNEGSRLTPGASSITSDGGEANLIILAEQPGDDARAGTVSTQARFAALRDADQTAMERKDARLKMQVAHREPDISSPLG